MGINTRKKCVIIVLFVFLVAELFINRIIISLYKGDVMVKGNMSDFGSNCDVVFNVDSGEWLGGLMEIQYFQGWAFCETVTDNTDKYFSIILNKVGTNECYYCNVNAQERPDVYGAFIDEKKIRSSLNGIDCKVSVVNLDDGEYELYLYCYENEEAYGVVDLGVEYEKKSNQLFLRQD